MAYKFGYDSLYNQFSGYTPEQLQQTLQEFEGAGDAWGLAQSDPNYAEVKARYDEYQKVLSDAMGSSGGGGLLQSTNTGSTTSTDNNSAGMQNIQGSVDAGFTGVNENLDTGFAGVGNQLTTLGEQTKGNIDSLSEVTTEGFNTVGDDISELSTNQTTGFEGVNTGLTDLGTSTATGFADVTEDISDLGISVGQNFDDVDTAVSEGFGSVETLLKDKYNLTDAQITKLSQDVLAGQTTLQDALTNLSTKTDTYYGGLADTQAQMQTGIGGVQSGLDEFKTDYKADTADAIQARTDLASNITGGFAKAEDDRQNLSNIASKDAFNIQEQIATANKGVLSAQDATQNKMSDIARKLSMNVGANTPEGVQAQNSYLSKLGKIKQQVNDSSFASSADPKLYNAYLDISQAFDDNGKLVATTNMMNGSEARALDMEGNLMVANFDTTGVRTAQNVYNINQLFSTVAA